MTFFKFFNQIKEQTKITNHVKEMIKNDKFTQIYELISYDYKISDSLLKEIIDIGTSNLFHQDTVNNNDLNTILKISNKDSHNRQIFIESMIKVTKDNNFGNNGLFLTTKSPFYCFTLELPQSVIKNSASPFTIKLNDIKKNSIEETFFNLVFNCINEYLEGTQKKIFQIDMVLGYIFFAHNPDKMSLYQKNKKIFRTNISTFQESYITSNTFGNIHLLDNFFNKSLYNLQTTDQFQESLLNKFKTIKDLETPSVFNSLKNLGKIELCPAIKDSILEINTSIEKVLSSQNSPDEKTIAIESQKYLIEIIDNYIIMADIITDPKDKTDFDNKVINTLLELNVKVTNLNQNIIEKDLNDLKMNYTKTKKTI
jgi:hypothetical protein